MVILHTWGPDPTAPLKGHSPDLGHSALQIGETYASFWPQNDSLVGTLVSLIKRRTARQPVTYAEEIEPEKGFMQRPSDFRDRLMELNEAAMLARWKELERSEWDANSYNCSHVARDLLAVGLSPALGSQLEALSEKHEHVPLTNCTPLGLHNAIVELLAATPRYPSK